MRALAAGVLLVASGAFSAWAAQRGFEFLLFGIPVGESASRLLFGATAILLIGAGVFRLFRA